MAGIGFGGKQPNNTSYIKQYNFFSDLFATISWVYQSSSVGQSNVITPSDQTVNVYIPNDLTVSGTIYNTSDSTVKENIEKLTREEMDLLLKLKPVKYNFLKDDAKKQHYGFIAQDVEKIFPNLVSQHNDVKNVNYMELIPLLVDKVGDLQKQLTFLEEKFLSLEK